VAATLNTMFEDYSKPGTGANAGALKQGRVQREFLNGKAYYR
jgi:hypothetical protein